MRLIYDWMGGFGKTSRKFWNRLREGGVEVRCYNPPRFGSPFGWLSRDHRKMLAVDATVRFITGLCVGRMWLGEPEKNIAPDTVFVPYHWPLDRAAKNMTVRAIDPVSNIPEYKICAVRLSKVSQPHDAIAELAVQAGGVR